MAAVEQYLHGIEVLEIDDGIRPIQTARSSIIGLIGTAPAADTDLFPINEPILFVGEKRKAALLGSTGTLRRSLYDIFSIVGATVVVVRVTEGADLPATWSNMVGDPTTKTGVWAFLTANIKVKVKPRILIAPGFTGTRPSNAVASVTINDGGSGYTSAPTIAFSGGGGSGAKGVAQILNGAIESVVMTEYGWGYTSAPTVTVSGGGGADAELTAVVGTAANPVGKALEAVANRLRAHVLLDGPNSTDTAAITYRQDYDNRRVMILDPYPLVWDRDINDYITRPGSALAAALQCRQDNERGFWWTFSNVSIPLVGGISRPVSWEPDNPDTDSNYLNGNEVTPIVRVDEINEGGFRFWGVRTTSSDPMWAFWNVSRTADMIFDSITRSMLWIMDRPLRPEVIEQGVDTVNYYLRSLERRGATLGGKAWLDKTFNTRDQLMAGKLRIEFDYEPPAPIERLTFGARRETAYYDVMIEQVLRDLAAGRAT